MVSPEPSVLRARLPFGRALAGRGFRVLLHDYGATADPAADVALAAAKLRSPVLFVTARDDLLVGRPGRRLRPRPRRRVGRGAPPGPPGPRAPRDAQIRSMLAPSCRSRSSMRS